MLGFELAILSFRLCLFADHFKHFLWNSRIKPFFVVEFLSLGKPPSFCLHFKLKNLLKSYFKICYTVHYSCIWVAFWTQTSTEGFYRTPPYLLTVETTQQIFANHFLKDNLNPFFKIWTLSFKSGDASATNLIFKFSAEHLTKA